MRLSPVRRGRTCAAVVLATLALGPAAPPVHGAPASRRAVAPRVTWAGTITSRVTIHSEFGTSRRIDYEGTLTVSAAPDGTATVGATHDDKDVRSCGPGKTSTVTEHGVLPAGTVVARGVTVSKADGRYVIDAPNSPIFSAAVTGTSMCTSTPPQPTASAVVDIPLPMSDVLQPGQTTLDGTRTEPVRPPCGSGWTACTGTMTVTWHLSRGKTLEIVKLKLYDEDQSFFVPAAGASSRARYAPLTYLSASAHPYFTTYGENGQGATVIYGTGELDGYAQDSVDTVTLEIQDRAGHVAKAEAASTSDLRGSFDRGPVTVGQIELAFVLPAAEAAKLDPGGKKGDNDQLTVKAVAVSDWGDKAEKSVTVKQLVRYTLPNRYGGRDVGYGGDDWVTPETRKDLVAITRWGKTRDHSIAFSWGDMSNMNGGRFYPHASHKTGVDVDGFFPKYYADGFFCNFPEGPQSKLFKKAKKHCSPTAHAADVLVALLRSPAGQGIDKIFVAYQKIDGDNFWGELQNENAPLPNGRRPSAVILPDPEHDTHFHIRFER